MMTTSGKERDDSAAPNFIADIVEADLAQGKHGGQVKTRFPPEPNGYLHIGHAKSICLNFSMAARSQTGTCNLRFDDTNPVAEDELFVRSIQEDVRWLGFDYEERLYFASDYFDQLYAFARRLIEKGKAYVDSQPLEAIREQRGSFFKAGQDSPFRERPATESLALFQRMKAGEFEEGSHVLRAKIDMSSGNLNLRDPLLYRIRKVAHHRTGDAWSIYPMYDFAHPLSDALEGITHSLCTLEFEAHRPLYDWLLQELEIPSPPRQIEFARLSLSQTLLSKRKLQALVKEGHVRGWDDPRMPTLAGLRRRGVSPKAIRDFCDRVGVSKRNSVVDLELFEHGLREDLNQRCARRMAVLKPLKVVLENYPEDREQFFPAQNHPEYPEQGTRQLPFSRELYIEQDDFVEHPPNKKWFRLAPGAEVRLRYACLITCNEVVKDAQGTPILLRCEWDPDSAGGTPRDGRKVKGTLHWVSARHALEAEVRLYDRLLKQDETEEEEQGEVDKPLAERLNPNSLQCLSGCKLEPALVDDADAVQFERLGYFVKDQDSRPGQLVFNRTLGLRDTWAKLATKT